MALKRHEVLIATVVTFVGWAHLTYWVPILRFLGYAFASGVLLSTTLVLIVALLSVRKKQSYCHAHSGQAVTFTTQLAWKEETRWLSGKGQYRRVPIFPSSAVLSESIDEILDWVLRDLVDVWYSHISRSRIFSNQINELARKVLVDVRARLEKQDVVEIAVLRFLPLITNHLKEFHDAEQAVRGKRLNRNVTESEELDLAIASRYQGGRLHPAASLTYLDTKLPEQEHLRKLVARLVPEILPDNVIQSRTVVCLVREMVSCAVLGPLMELLSDPDTWNRLLEAYGRKVLQDRKTVRKLRAALDEHASPHPKVATPYAFSKLSPYDDERKFERFIRSIRQCNNISDARRFRSEVASQLKRELRLEGHDRTYTRRLETGKHLLDQKVASFSSLSKSTSSVNAGKQVTPRRSGIENASLREFLRNASGLSYFMEYMDRQQLVTLVQFWIVVDGFRNPLENDVGEAPELGGVAHSWTESDRADMAQISTAYLSRPELKVPAASRNAVCEFLNAGGKASPIQYKRARSAILRAQTSSLEEMQEKHFPAFRESDLFYKLLTFDDPSMIETPRTIVPRAPSDAFSHASFTEHPTEQPQGRVKPGTNRLINSRTDAKLPSHTSNDRLVSKPRPSLDVRTTGPLFGDDVEPETLVTSIHDLEEPSPLVQDQPPRSQAQVVEAIEAALSTIMTDNTLDPFERDTLDPESAKGLEPHLDKLVQPNAEKKERPNLASLGLINASSRIGVFVDDDLFDDEEKFLEDEYADPEEHWQNGEAEDEVVEAAPGDLGLSEAISALTTDIDRLVAQESIVDALTRKAELTNNVAELRILGKSKSSLQREIRRKELQRQQYVIQESDNSLFGRASVDIKSIMVGKESDGQEFALYVIEVQKKAAEHLPAASWIVARRYSEFHDLHQRLRHIYPTVRQLEFPRRRLVMKLQRDFLHRRRVSLEHYLRQLLQLPVVCRSRDLRAFLSQRPILSNGDDEKRDDDRADIVSRLYNSVTDGMDEFLGNIPMLDQLSIAGQNLISAATSQYHGTLNPAAQAEPESVSVVQAREAQAEPEAFETQTMEPFVKPICDLFLEIFELSRSQNWLRGRAVVVVLHQLLGGTVERKIREAARNLASDTSVLRHLAFVKDLMWPGGTLQRNRSGRTEDEKKLSRKEASVVLAALMPEMAGGVVGRANAQVAGRRVFATMNNSRLNAHLAYKLLDEAVAILFPTSTVRRL